MKNILIFIQICFISLAWAKEPANDRTVIDESTIIETAEQLEFLHAYNKAKALNQKWFILFLGKDVGSLESYLESKYDHLDVSNSSYGFNVAVLDKINDALVKINAQKDIASYAIITDAQEEIIIPTSPIYQRKRGRFLDELERKLITAGSENIPLQLDQRADFKSIEHKIRAGFDQKSEWVKKSIDEVLNRATNFKNSSKKFKVLHYSVITKINYLNSGQEEISVDNIGTTDVQVHGTRYSFKAYENPGFDQTAIKALRNTFYNNLSEYQEFEKLMLARVSAYQQYFEGNEASVDGLKEGFGKSVFIAQQDKVENDEDKTKFLELCNFLSDQFDQQTTNTKYEAIVDLESVERGEDLAPLLEMIIKNDVKTKDALLNLYPYYGIAKQYVDGKNEFRVFFSKFNLWTKTGDLTNDDKIEEAYNVKSVDFIASKNNTVKSKYFYSLSDLIVRYKFITSQNSNNVITREILSSEDEGIAFSIAQKDYYDQYVAKWGTDSAFIFIAYWSAQWTRDLTAAHFARQLAFEFGAFFVEEMAKQLGKGLF